MSGLCPCAACSAMPLDSNNAKFHRDPKTGIAPIHEWGWECGRGWVSDSRFGSGTVIARANRDHTREVYRQAERMRKESTIETRLEAL